MSEPFGDGIERLLKATGRRPAPPPERAARVREAVRAHWHVDLRRRGRRRALWIGVAAAAALVSAVLVARPWREVAAPLAGVAGKVERVEPPGSFRAGDPIDVGGTVSTEAGGRIALRLASGDALRLDRRTRIRLLSDHTVALEVGAIYVDASSAAGLLEIQTPFGILEDWGTQFLVRLGDGSLRLSVREGRVALGAGTDRVVIAAGQLLEIDGDRRNVRLQTASGEAWAWIDDIVPLLPIEGRSAREFLDWMARERGLRLVFESEELAREASAVTLRGAIEGMTLDQALESVLVTCGMRHRIEGDVLRVTSVQGARTGRE